MKIVTYVVYYDFGFAPNPFMGYCTLATCKPLIRKQIEVGDWVMAIASKRFEKQGHKLLYAMKVTEKLTFNEYWNAPRFQCKKPIMNGSLQRTFGDNVYFFDDLKDEWHQADCRHSNENGEINEFHLNRDTGGEYVLISDDFYYLGEDATVIPDKYIDSFWKRPNCKYIRDESLKKEIVSWIRKSFGQGMTGFPIEFKKKKFKRLK